MARFNKLAQEGDAVHQRDGAQSAIDFYERALLDPDFEDFGRIHMRMALIHQDDRRFPEAAYHFLACMRDDRVDKVDREFICRGGYEEVTAPLLLRDLPERAQVFILEPQLFSGPFTSGDRLPMGRIEVTVESSGHRPRKSEFMLDGPLEWEARLGLPLRQGQLVPDGFVADGQPEDKDDFVAEGPEPASASGASHWPLYLTAGVGAGVVAAGIGIGLDNQTKFEETRATQAAGTCAPVPGQLPCNQSITDANNRAQWADVMWISGTAMVTTAVVLWLLSDDNPQPEETQ